MALDPGKRAGGAVRLADHVVPTGREEAVCRFAQRVQVLSFRPGHTPRTEIQNSHRFGVIRPAHSIRVMCGRAVPRRSAFAMRRPRILHERKRARRRRSPDGEATFVEIDRDAARPRLRGPPVAPRPGAHVVAAGRQPASCSAAWSGCSRSPRHRHPGHHGGDHRRRALAGRRLARAAPAGARRRRGGRPGRRDRAGRADRRPAAVGRDEPDPRAAEEPPQRRRTSSRAGSRTRA